MFLTRESSHDTIAVSFSPGSSSDMSLASFLKILMIFCQDIEIVACDFKRAAYIQRSAMCAIARSIHSRPLSTLTTGLPRPGLGQHDPQLPHDGREFARVGLHRAHVRVDIQGHRHARMAQAARHGPHVVLPAIIMMAKACLRSWKVQEKPFLLQKAEKPLPSCVGRNRSCSLPLGLWGVLTQGARAGSRWHVDR